MMKRRKPVVKSEKVDCNITYLDCPAKTYVDENNKTILGQTVLSHTTIVGLVAKEILKRMPQFLADLFPSGSALVAASHDIGKVSPTFFLKLIKLVEPHWEVNYPALLGYNGLDENQLWGGHAGVSAVTIKEMIGNENVSIIVGQHHGYTPNIDAYYATQECFGGEHWNNQRMLLIDQLQSIMNENFPRVETYAQLRAISGLTSVSDWIGSGEYFENPNQPWEDKISLAIDYAGFIQPKYINELSFQDVFGEKYKPLPTQTALYDQCNDQGVYVLEAPMGLGKTEAALYAAYRLLSQGKATGIYFALPTQLTSNKIYERFNKFLSAILAPDCFHQKALLLHSGAWLLEQEMGEEGRPGGSWYSQQKRGLLAPFAVGTIDQALMSVMNVKHGFVRAFGLAGKVVILDEVHSYDAYTSVLLDEMIELLRELKCTVIILSATLNQSRRQQLLKRGVTQSSYPLITVSYNKEKESVREYTVPPLKKKSVLIKLIRNDLNIALNECLQRAEAGQQVVWIENTITEAQNRYFDFAARCADLGIECGLLHSRYTVIDREMNESYWVALYGKENWESRARQGRILIGTQVLEQSLDIDADFLVSHIAPTDMLLQRLGRLWRHEDTPRVQNATCEAWILTPAFDDAVNNPRKFFGSTAMVYSPYILCRTLKAWEGLMQTGGNLILPDDIRQLIELTYDEVEEVGLMQTWKKELLEGSKWTKGLNALKQLAKLSLSKSGKTLPESKAQTRYSETDSGQILLVKQLNIDKKTKELHLILLDGKKLVIPWQKNKKTRNEWKKISATLMKYFVSCPIWKLPTSLSRQWYQEVGLGHALYLGDPLHENVPFVLATIDSMGALCGPTGGRFNEKQSYYYRNDFGLKIEGKEEK